MHMKQSLANTLRILSCQMVEQAESGHPGLPLGFADVITALLYEISYDHSDPNWASRDRIVFSAGHGCALWYSVLYGLGLRTKNDLEKFRTLNSSTPGHLEKSSGVEITTGPLGMGFAYAVGLALGERLMHARTSAIDHHTFIICSDGDLMEGVSYEAASLAGQYNLSKIIALWDDNSITIDGPTNISRNEDMKQRFIAQNWEVIEVDGHNIELIQAAIARAKTHATKPTLIACKTTIGKHSVLENTSKVHGSPLGAENMKKLKIALNWNEANCMQAFHDEFAKIKTQARAKAIEWKKQYRNEDFKKELKLEKTDELRTLLQNDFATRAHSQNILEHMLQTNDNLIIASADLSTSCGTNPKSGKKISAQDFSGNLLPCGVRENAMVAITAGISMHSQLQAIASTFLVFSDYARPAIRLAALMNVPMILIATHDSICLGEDGPTHQPIEHLDALRCMPNLFVARPADGFETLLCYEKIIANMLKKNEHENERGNEHDTEYDAHHSMLFNEHARASVLVLTRETLPSIHNDFINENNLTFFGENEKNGYIISTGSQAYLALQLAKNLKKTFISMPYMKKKEMNCGMPINIIEASSGMCWNYLFNQAKIFNIKRFGASSKQKDLLEYFGFTIENLTNWIKQS